jgi:outer membrane receptor protein involved in Fe transport
VSLRYFAPSGWFATLGATWVRQTVERLPASTLASGTSDFTLVDAALGYWLPSRRGQISIEARNLFDRQFNYQDVNFQTSEPRSPRFLPERSVFVRLTVSF